MMALKKIYYNFFYHWLRSFTLGFMVKTCANQFQVDLEVYFFLGANHCQVDGFNYMLMTLFVVYCLCACFTFL
jgi:hypothetical protein